MYVHIIFYIINALTCNWLQLCIDQFECLTPILPPSSLDIKPQAFNYFSCQGSREFDVKGFSRGGEFKLGLEFQPEVSS